MKNLDLKSDFWPKNFENPQASSSVEISRLFLADDITVSIMMFKNGERAIVMGKKALDKVIVVDDDGSYMSIEGVR